MTNIIRELGSSMLVKDSDLHPGLLWLWFHHGMLRPGHESRHFIPLLINAELLHLSRHCCTWSTRTFFQKPRCIQRRWGSWCFCWFSLLWWASMLFIAKVTFCFLNSLTSRLSKCVNQSFGHYYGEAMIWKWSICVYWAKIHFKFRELNPCDGCWAARRSGTKLCSSCTLIIIQGQFLRPTLRLVQDQAFFRFMAHNCKIYNHCSRLSSQCWAFPSLSSFTDRHWCVCYCRSYHLTAYRRGQWVDDLTFSLQCWGQWAPLFSYFLSLIVSHYGFIMKSF